MSKLFRFGFIHRVWTIILCCIIFSAVNVGAEQQFSSADLPGSTSGTSVWEKAFADYLNENGFDIKIYPFNSLGSFAEVSDIMRQGLIQFCVCGPFPYFRSSPAVFGDLIPYLWDDNEHHLRFIRSKGGLIDKVNETSTKTGIRLLDWVHTSGPMGLFTVKKPVRKLEDAEGLRLRFLAPPQKVMYEAMGAKGVGIPWSDVYTALQTGMVDGYVHGPDTALKFRHTEVFKYFTRLEVGYVSMGVSMSESYYQSLSEKQKKILSEAVEAARKANKKWVDEFVTKNLEKLKADGVEVITLSPAEKERFKNKIADSRKKMAPPPVVQYYFEASAKFR